MRWIPSVALHSSDRSTSPYCVLCNNSALSLLLRLASPPIHNSPLPPRHSPHLVLSISDLETVCCWRCCLPSRPVRSREHLLFIYMWGVLAEAHIQRGLQTFIHTFTHRRRSVNHAQRHLLTPARRSRGSDQQPSGYQPPGYQPAPPLSQSRLVQRASFFLQHIG